jgi:hypothetical protein
MDRQIEKMVVTMLKTKLNAQNHCRHSANLSSLQKSILKSSEYFSTREMKSCQTFAPLLSAVYITPKSIGINTMST